MDLSAKYAAEHGLSLDTSLTLHDLGVSAYYGSNAERGALGAFLNAVSQKRVASGSYLLVESLDRLSRERAREALTLFLSILEQGITIVTLADNKVYTPAGDENGHDLIFSIMIMQRAHEESVTKSRRIKAAWSSKRLLIAEKKLTAQCPNWMRLNESRTAFEFLPDRVEVINLILEWARIGMGQAQIAKRLNERSIPQFSNHGTGWHSSYVQKILTSPALYGQFQPRIHENKKSIPHGDPVPDYYPSLITKEEFFLLQSVRSDRAFGGGKSKKGNSVPNLLSGVAKCGYCGSTMVLVGATAKRIPSVDGIGVTRPSAKVVVCDGARRGLNCFAVQWNYRDFERSFLTFCGGSELETILSNVTSGPDMKNKSLDIKEQIQATFAEIREVQRRLNTWMNAIEGGQDTPPTAMQRIRDLEHELQRLDAKAKNLEMELHISNASVQEAEKATQSIRSLVSGLDSLEGDTLFMKRVALADQIRRNIEVVKVFPAGRLFSEQMIENIRFGLTQGGYDDHQIDEYIGERYPTAPQRQGRGNRGRYVSRKDIRRFFMIQAKNGDFRVVYPNYEDPSKINSLVSVEEHPETGNNRINTVSDWDNILGKETGLTVT